MVEKLTKMEKMLSEGQLAADFAVVKAKTRGWKASAKRIRKFTIDFAVVAKEFRAASVAEALASKE